MNLREAVRFALAPADHRLGIRFRHRRRQPRHRNLRHHQSAQSRPAWKPSPTSSKRNFCMTEEPYRWLEAIGQSPRIRARPAQGRLARLCRQPAGRDSSARRRRRAVARCSNCSTGTPWPVWGIRRDIEKIRQAAIDAAHLEAFTRAPEDVSLRRLVGFGLSPQLKTNFDQIFSAPFLVELLLAELGAEPAPAICSSACTLTAPFKSQSGGASDGGQPAGGGVRRANLAEGGVAGQNQPRRKSLTSSCRPGGARCKTNGWPNRSPTPPGARPAGARRSRARPSRSAGSPATLPVPPATSRSRWPSWACDFFRRQSAIRNPKSEIFP